MLPLWAVGQSGVGRDEGVLRNEVLDSGVASVQLIPEGRVLAPPVVTLSGEATSLLRLRKTQSAPAGLSDSPLRPLLAAR